MCMSVILSEAIIDICNDTISQHYLFLVYNSNILLGPKISHFTKQALVEVNEAEAYCYLYL